MARTSRHYSLLRESLFWNRGLDRDADSSYETADGQLGADLNRYSSTVEMKHGGETVAKLEHGSELRALAFSPNGRWLATATKDGGMRLWPLQAAELIERACQLLARNLTENEWKEARLEGPYRKTCPNLP